MNQRAKNTTKPCGPSHMHTHTQACQNSHNAYTYTCFNTHGKNAQAQT